MFILDDILLSPVRGITWVFKKVHQAALDEIDQRGERITAELSELYRMLEAGAITEEEFDARERQLLDQLDEIEEIKRSDEAEGDETGSESDEEGEEAGESGEMS